MNGIVKAGEARLQSRPISPAANIEPMTLRQSAVDPVHVLETRIEELESELAELRSSLPVRLRAAGEEGRKAGLRERDETAAKRLAVLEKGIAVTLDSWNDRLGSMGAFSIAIARTVLANLVGDPEWRADFVRQAVAQRLRQLDENAVIGIRVSAADFADDTEVAALSPDRRVSVRVSEELAAGECVVDLKMGHQELGPDAQWQHIAALLDELGEEQC